jgi:hypothetical protein
MNPVTENVIYIAASVLIPLVPAYYLYRGLQSTAEVTGESKGIGKLLGNVKFRLTGSFGGYFLLVVTLIGFIQLKTKEHIASTENGVHSTNENKVEEYEFIAKIKNEKGSQIDPKDVKIELQPNVRDQTVLPTGTVRFRVMLDQDAFGQPTYPAGINIGYKAGYETRTIDFSQMEELGIKIDKTTKRIEVANPIELKQTPADDTYNPKGNVKIEPVNAAEG